MVLCTHCLPQSHVICTPAAAAVIKTYSPNLMVHPLMRQSPAHSTAGGAPPPSSADTDPDPDQVASKIIDMLPRLHVLVVGPGLGRDPLMHQTVAAVLAAVRAQRPGMPVVMDADALQLVQSDPELVMGWEDVVLTPNVVEFARLQRALNLEPREDSDNGQDDDDSDTAQVEELSRALGGVAVIQKGARDFFSNGRVTLTVDLEGGRKRSGGQGDTLTGSIATFLAWRKAYKDGLWDHGHKLDPKELLGLAVFGGAAITRVRMALVIQSPHNSEIPSSALTSKPHICGK
jgi:ATP-dependent NAD(P)H-hydrate dehydratase